jgi:hypothetical protein
LKVTPWAENLSRWKSYSKSDAAKRCQSTNLHCTAALLRFGCLTTLALRRGLVLAAAYSAELRLPRRGRPLAARSSHLLVVNDSDEAMRTRTNRGLASASPGMSIPASRASGTPASSTQFNRQRDVAGALACALTRPKLPLAARSYVDCEDVHWPVVAQRPGVHRRRRFCAVRCNALSGTRR